MFSGESEHGSLTDWVKKSMKECFDRFIIQNERSLYHRADRQAIRDWCSEMATGGIIRQSRESYFEEPRA